jgi:hypothetical protein
MPKRTRDYKGEYARRIAKGLAQGRSRSQARGHAKATEAPARWSGRPIPDERIQLALRTLRQRGNFAEAARAAKVSPERLRKYAVERGLIEKTGRRWRTRAELPRLMPIFSKGKSLTIVVANSEAASLVGTYMAAVGRFLETNNRSALSPFIGHSVLDTSGKEHPFETNPNILYRLAAGGEHSFEQIYRIVI